MIYFKISSVIEDSDNTNLSSIISTANTNYIVKIGYTDDNSDTAKNRDLIYKTENPSIIHYKYIAEGTRKDETLIHLFLKDHLYAGREWFRLTQEVINFVESVETIEDIRDRILGTKRLIEKDKNYKEKSEVLYRLIPAILESINIQSGLDYFEEYYRISDNLRSLVEYSNNYEKDILDVVQELYFDEYKNILSQYEINKSYSDSVFISKYNTLTNFIDKMKFLCNYVKDGNNVNNIQFLIDDDVINFYLVLGVEKIESHSYIRIRLDREINKLINNQHIDLSEEIYKIFQIGERYANKIIKLQLKTIYDSMNYKANPKASDLEEWFEIRKVNYIEEGKKINGLELIKKKE